MTAANAVLSFNVRMKDAVSHAKWGKDGVCLHDHTPRHLTLRLPEAMIPREGFIQLDEPSAVTPAYHHSGARTLQ